MKTYLAFRGRLTRLEAALATHQRIGVKTGFERGFLSAKMNSAENGAEFVWEGLENTVLDWLSRIEPASTREFRKVRVMRIRTEGNRNVVTDLKRLQRPAYDAPARAGLEDFIRAWIVYRKKNVMDSSSEPRRRAKKNARQNARFGAESALSAAALAVLAQERNDTELGALARVVLLPAPGIAPADL
jgi:hypothetical protein